MKKMVGDDDDVVDDDDILMFSYACLFRLGDG